MNHKYKLVWFSDELEGYECIRCGYQTVDPDDPNKCTYWYETITVECPLCDTVVHTFKHRVYDRPRPEKYWDRHIYELDVHDWCMVEKG
jgi:hypothetical protein